MQFGEAAAPLDPANEEAVLGELSRCLRLRLAGYRTTIAEDDATVADPASGPRKTVAARLLRIEKAILGQALAHVESLHGAGAGAAGVSVKFKLA